jgi:hypothetical protein
LDSRESPPIVRRLEPLPSADQLAPWRRANQLTSCFLYWAPVRAFPIPQEQCDWLVTFLLRWSDLCRKKLQLCPESFLQMKVIQPDLCDPFLKQSLDLSPVFGLSRKPAAPLPALPTQDEVDRMARGELKYSFNAYVADYCYWFLNNDEKKILQFFGHGGLSIFYRKAGPPPNLPKVKLPKVMTEHPLFQKINIEEKMASAARMTDPFLAKSKELFGVGLEDTPQYPGLMFIVPLLTSADFFQQADEAKKWFELFEIYVNESRADQGVLFATKTDIEKEMAEVLQTFEQEGRKYPR